MSEITYDEFEKLERCQIKQSGQVVQKGSAKEFVLKILEDRPYSRNELKTMAEDADYHFNNGSGVSSNVNFALDELVNEGFIEACFGNNDSIVYGLKKKK